MRGTCQCGQLSAEIDDGAKPMTIACHCTSCQKRSGSPFGEVAYFLEDEVSIAGDAREYTRPTDTGATLTNGFCPRCGSSLYVKVERFPELFGITVGCISDPAFPPPQLSVYEEVKHHWVGLPEGTAHYDRGRGSATE